MRKRWINRVAILGVVLLTSIGGLWLWDAKDYPIPWTYNWVVDPFADYSKLNLDKDLSFAHNIQFTQNWLQFHRASRLRKKWIKSLEDSYWVLEGFGDFEKTAAIYFESGEQPEVRLISKKGRPYSNLSVSQREDRLIFRIEIESGSKPELIGISSRSEDSVHLYCYEEEIGFYLKRVPDSTFFDSLPEAK